MAGYTADTILEALELAGEVWSKTTLGLKEEKLSYAHELHRFRLFSLPQIAKIVRLNSRYIYEELSPNAKKGGRFDPATLSTLARIRRAHIQGQRVPHQLISMGIKGGTSYTCLTALTKIPYSNYYEVAREAAARAEQEELKAYTVDRSPEAQAMRESVREAKAKMTEDNREFFQARKKEIFSLRDQGLSVTAIGEATSTDKGYVSKVLRGLR